MKSIINRLYNGYFKYVFRKNSSDNPNITSMKNNFILIMIFTIVVIAICYEPQMAILHNFVLFYSIFWICIIPLLWKKTLNHWSKFKHHFKKEKIEWTLADKAFLTEISVFVQIVSMFLFVINWSLVFAEGTLVPKMTTYGILIVFFFLWVWYKTRKAKIKDDTKK